MTAEPAYCHRDHPIFLWECASTVQTLLWRKWSISFMFQQTALLISGFDLFLPREWFQRTLEQSLWRSSKFDRAQFAAYPCKQSIASSEDYWLAMLLLLDLNFRFGTFQNQLSAIRNSCEYPQVGACVFRNQLPKFQALLSSDVSCSRYLRLLL